MASGAPPPYSSYGSNYPQQGYPGGGDPMKQPNPSQPSAPPPEAWNQPAQPPNTGGYPPYGYNAPVSQGGGPPSGPGYAAVYPAGNTGGYDNHSYGAYPAQPAGTHEVEESALRDNQWNASSFSDKRIRQAFIRKVYLILMTQLAFTFAIVCVFSFYQPIKTWMRSGANQAVYWVSYAVFLVTYIILVCVPSVRRKVPGNYICLTIFTLALTYMAATLSSFHDTYIVVVAIGITVAVCLAISLFAIQTKIDFTMCSGLLFALLMVLIFFGFSILICYLVTRNHFALYVMNCVYGGLAALVFGLFLAYDTQLVIGGRRYQLSEEDYIEGALQLYLDVVYLFIIILGLFGYNK